MKSQGERASRVVRAALFASMVLASGASGCGGGQTTFGDGGDTFDAGSRRDGSAADPDADAAAVVDAAAEDAGREQSDAGTDAGLVCTADADCDDADPCTADRCLVTGCEHVPVDADGDGVPAGEVAGFMCEGTDCDDGDPAVHPGASEVCNGVDDNCDGFIDDLCECVPGTPDTCTTSCGTTGSRVCEAAYVWGDCVPPEEACNRADDNCDGFIDETLACSPELVGSCLSACGTTGTRICDASCAWGSCAPPAEICNGLDDDCDGATDEDFGCSPADTGSCTTSCGTTGSQVCGATCAWGACAPPAETCNALDDDCDGLIDETLTCVQGTLGSCTSTCGTAGSRTCSSSCSWGSCSPPVETCNGLDDDCDGARDDGFACVAGSGGACTSGCGSTGTRTCDPASCAWGACSPPGEVCNGTDDDCDGLADETFTCARGAAEACTSSCGSAGSRTCSAACSWGACTPPTEICNGVDDDCDAIVDEGFTCRRDATRSCWSGCGTTGTQTCNGSCAWGACVPPGETCNGRDDDCDGAIDEVFECVAWSGSRSCTTACGTTGTQNCNSSCAWGSCIPPAESCNGVDDDCDGEIDDSAPCSSGSVCTSGACRSIPGSCTGYRYGGHAYAICTTDMTWSDARSICTSYGGHLVTVTSSGEQSFLAGLIAGRCWHGLYRGSSCTWQWVTGEPVSYTYWDPGQPSSSCGVQDCGDFWWGPSWTWDDYWCTSMARYACEWDA